MNKLLLAFFGIYPIPKNIGVSAGDYKGFIERYAMGVKYARPLMIKQRYELINLSDLGNPDAPLTITRTRELINLENLEELLDPRDKRFRTHRDIDMRFWVSPLAKTKKNNGVE